MTDKELYEKLIKAYTYDPEDGLFRYTSNRQAKKIGDVAGTDHLGYIRISLDGKRYLAHIMAWLYCFEELPENELDHINGNKSDNRLDNLREATRSQNIMNTKARSDNKSGVKGVKLQPNGKYSARIIIKGKEKHLGTFNSIEEAAQAYEIAAKEVFGEFYNSGN